MKVFINLQRIFYVPKYVFEARHSSSMFVVYRISSNIKQLLSLLAQAYFKNVVSFFDNATKNVVMNILKAIYIFIT